MRARHLDIGAIDIGTLAARTLLSVADKFERKEKTSDDTGGAEAQLQLATERLDEEQKQLAITAFEKAIPKCESPIERRLLPWLICQPYKFFPHRPLVLLEGESALLPERHVAIVPQLKIGRYRADFALAARRGGPIRFVIVECDGAEFHKDVERDIARDLVLLSNNRVLDICFFSGVEIMKEPSYAARQAAEALGHAWDKRNESMDKKFGRVRERMA